MPPKEEDLLVRLRNHHFEGFKGHQLDQLWTASMNIKELEQEQRDTAEFISIKEDEVKGISEHF
jgi:hypothetical protein